jgi:hypothetical protein
VFESLKDRGIEVVGRDHGSFFLVSHLSGNRFDLDSSLGHYHLGDNLSNRFRSINTGIGTEVREAIITRPLTSMPLS